MVVAVGLCCFLDLFRNGVCMKYESDIIERFMADPALLYAYVENSVIDLAMNAITMTENARTSEPFERARDRTEGIIKCAQDQFLASPLAQEWEAEKEQEERDYIRDMEIDARAEERRGPPLEGWIEATQREKKEWSQNGGTT